MRWTVLCNKDLWVLVFDRSPAYAHEWKDADICCFQSNEICFLFLFAVLLNPPDLSAFKKLLRQTSMPVIVSLSDRPYVTFRNWMPLMGT